MTMGGTPDAMVLRTCGISKTRKIGGAEHELQCWIGIIIYMGVVDIPAVKDYWKGGLYPDHGWTSYLSATRFKEIKHYFHISECSNTSEQQLQLWHYKVDPLLNQL